MAVILVAVHGRERVAGRGNDTHAGGFDDPCAGRVPDVGQDQRIARDMQLAQLLGVRDNVVPGKSCWVSHDASSSSVMVKIPRGPWRNGMVRRAASSMWIRGAGGGSLSKKVPGP